MTVLALSASCLTGCGVLGDGTTADRPENARRQSRWSELDGLAEEHTETTGHVTSVAAVRQGGR